MELCSQFGSNFKKPYGWASIRFGHAPKFRDIEKATDFDRQRPYYRLASRPIHAGPKGIAFDIGVFRSQGRSCSLAQVMLASQIPATPCVFRSCRSLRPY